MSVCEEHQREPLPSAPGPFLSEEAADTYANKIALHKKPFLKFLDEFNWKYPASDPNQQFLDIGCGTGDVTRERILPRCPPCRRLVAVDFSAKMLEYARERFAHPLIEYKQLDIGLSVDDFLADYGTFQRVYSLRVLHWVRDQPRAFSNISRLMVKGGECLLLFLGRCDTFEFIGKMAELEAWKKYSDLFRAVIPKTHAMTDVAQLREYAENLVQTAGLQLIQLDIWERDSSFLNTEDAVEMFLMANPVLPILPEEEKAAFIADARKHVPEWRSVYNKSSPLPFASFVVHAFKP
ncbi:juvenile hormone acid O-methyltransferase-like [Haemaphysalis longicornis]